MMKTLPAATVLVSLAFSVASSPAWAGSATWNSNPTNSNWNTAATPINGTFSNLPDGSNLTAGVNKFQASYTGGDANDLTLTVIQ